VAPGPGAQTRPVECVPIALDDLCRELRVPNPATYEVLPLQPG